MAKSKRKIKSKIKKPMEKNKINLENLFVLNMILFSTVAILHFFRIILRTPVLVGSFELPMWISGLGLIVLAFLIWQNWIRTEQSIKTCAKILMGIFAIDLLGVLYIWYQNIEFFGFTGTTYAIAAVIDAAIVLGLFWYIKTR